MNIKLVKRASRSQKYTILVPVEYFDNLGYVENDIVDVDIVVNSGQLAQNCANDFVKSDIDVESQSIINEGCNAEKINGDIIPYGTIIPIDSMLYVGKKLYYAVNGTIVERDGNRFEIDIHTGKIKNLTCAKHLAEVQHQKINYAKFV